MCIYIYICIYMYMLYIISNLIMGPAGRCCPCAGSRRCCLILWMYKPTRSDSYPNSIRLSSTQ